MLARLVTYVPRSAGLKTAKTSSPRPATPSAPRRLSRRSLCTSAILTSEELLSFRPSAKAKSVRAIEASSLLPLEEYSKSRRSVYYPLRRLLKKDRVLMVGPYATITFENYDLMWMQTQEMLFIEKGEVNEELDAYNPLVPNGSNLIVTLMFEIENPIRRDQVLRRLGHVEDTLSLSVDGKFNILAKSVDGHDIERTSEDGKTSAVHFLKFDFNDQQRLDMLRIAEKGVGTVELAFSHPEYAHSVKLSQKTIQDISKDLL